MDFLGVSYKKEWSKSHLFTKGNHDNPPVCQNHPNYIGDYGYLKDHDIYFISGAYSIDFARRTPYIDWWPDEELSIEQFGKIKQEILEIKPKIIISHDGPEEVTKEMFNIHRFLKNRTSSMLQEIFDTYKPEKWIFGHWHRSMQKIIDGTLFICLSELEIIKL